MLRDRQDLAQLDSFIRRLFRPASTKHPAAKLIDVFTHLSELSAISVLMREHPCALVTVCLQTAVSGYLTPHSTISLSLTADLHTLNSKSELKFSGPLEPVAPRGLTVVEGREGDIHIGVSQMTKSETKTVRKARTKKLKQLKKHKTEGNIRSTLYFPPYYGNHTVVSLLW